MFRFISPIVRIVSGKMINDFQNLFRSIPLRGSRQSIFSGHLEFRCISQSRIPHYNFTIKTRAQNQAVMAERGGDRGGFGRGFGGRGDRGDRGRGKEEQWVPVTKLGRLIKEGRIPSLEQIYLHSLPVKEHQIIETLLGWAEHKNEGSLELLRVVMFREEPELATRADDNGEEGGDAASLISSSEWSETMQNLITTLSPSPTSTRGGYAIRGWELDFPQIRSTITCKKFEVLCGDLFEISLIPLKEVLKHSGLKVDAVELIGYATSVPKLQVHVFSFSSCWNTSIRSLIEELCGDLWEKSLIPFKEVLKHSGLKVDEVELIGNATRVQSYRGVSSKKFAQYVVSGLTDAGEKYSSRDLTSPIKANLYLSLSKSGILSLDRVDAVIEVAEWVEVPKRI
ncbi:hypothetical protein HHK36_000617 [Tetracentron sinense]|uniref:Uncharacterized protein n=1 Tax=Tetracentron sinense TaxID=13715 RepID=A0A834ZRD4_TETSI|nr:hypothetical protein HHK36_000617 [Tetracentron sinense]